MTLLAEIKARCPAEVLATRDSDAIAAAVSVGRVKNVPTEIGNGLILATIGIEAGNTLLDVISSEADFRYVRPLLEQGRLDISTPLVRSVLVNLTSAENAAALLALAERPDPITEYQVRCTLWNDAGEWLGD